MKWNNKTCFCVCGIVYLSTIFISFAHFAGGGGGGGGGTPTDSIVTTMTAVDATPNGSVSGQSSSEAQRIGGITNQAGLCTRSKAENQHGQRLNP